MREMTRELSTCELISLVLFVQIVGKCQSEILTIRGGNVHVRGKFGLHLFMDSEGHRKNTTC